MNSVETSVRQASIPFREEAAFLVAAAERDRADFARALHDDLAQKLTVATIELSLWQADLDSGAGCDRSEMRRKIETISELLNGAAQSARAVSGALRPRTLDSFGLFAALEGIVSRFQKRTGASCRVQQGAGELAAAPDIAIQIVRIVGSLFADEASNAWTCVSLTVSERNSGIEIGLSVVGGSPSLSREATARIKVFGGKVRAGSGRLVLWMPK
jgi:signal transduction histidine kinase